MRYLLTALLVFTLSYAHAQAYRVYWAGDRLVIEKGDGTAPQSVHSSQARIVAYENSIGVFYGALGINPSKSELLDATGNPYSTVSTTAAVKALMTSSNAAIYTQTQVNSLLTGYYQRVSVATKALASAQATGSQPKIITVSVDESDGNRAGNKYLYDGDNQPLGQPLF